ncbi:MAG: MBL fold metallo-hydrolase [Actinomycetota bacterium]
MSIDFLTQDVPPYGKVEVTTATIRRVTAHNPSKFTYHGTGTYIVGHGDVAVIDPGPRLDEHREALARALDGERVQSILVTHCHSDHSPLAAWLAAETGAPLKAVGPHPSDPWDIGALPDGALEYREPESPDTAGSESADPPTVEESIDRAFVPDVEVRAGDVVAAADGWTMRAVPTPGHTSNHCCFALDDGTETSLFSGDHLMGWSTTVIGPPDGDIITYLRSLDVVVERNDAVAYPTHGPPVRNPASFAAQLLAHRRDRHAQVLNAVEAGEATIPDIVVDLYRDVHPRLHKPAAASVLAHLVALVDEGRVVTDDERPRLDGTYRPA